MQLNTMDCSGRSNNAERDSDLGDDLSHDDHSDDEMRDCDSVDGDHISSRAGRLNSTVASNGGDMSYGGAGVGGGGGGGGGNGRSPDPSTDMQMGHHHQFPPNHPLNALGSFMGIGGLHGIPSLQHNDVLEKLKMQVRDMEQDYAAAAHAAAFGANVLPTPINTAFTLPPTTMASFGHAAQNMAAHTVNGNLANGNLTNAHNSTNASATAGGALTNGGSVGGGGGGGGGNSSFSFTSPTAPSTKDVNPASNSSTSSEASNSSQQNNGWSFEEQYKQVRQLYEINDDPKRKEFLDDLFSFMQKRGTPINRLPIMAKSVLDLYELYNLVIARGGLVDVINKKLWQEIIKGLHLPSSITSAAFTLRTQYMKYLYPYECEKKNLSSPAELQAAIDGNRREGRRSSYGQYEAMHNQMQMPQMSRQSLTGGMQQMSPLALVTHAANNQQAQAAAAAAAAAHHRLMGPSFGQVPNLVTHEIEQRMMEYLKLIQVKKEQNAAVASGGGGSIGAASHQQQQQRQRSQSPEITTREALNALEMSRVALWQMYHNNTSPPASVNTSPQGGGGSASVGAGGAGNGHVEPQRSEALNLSDSPPNLTTIKREREREPSPEPERDDFHQPPPAKRVGASSSLMPHGFPASFYLPHGMAAAAAAAANFHHANNSSGGAIHHDERPDDEDDDNEEDGEHNTTANSSLHDDNERQLNGHHSHHMHHHHHHHNNNNNNNDKSDDSAIENSPSTSASAGNGHISPVSTKKIHLSKQPQMNCGSEASAVGGASINPLETLSLLSGMQFRVTRNGTGANGEQQLSVNLELNGIKYSGVLMANVQPANNTSAVTTDCKHNKDDSMDTETQNSGEGDEAIATETSPKATKTNAASAGITNGPSSVVLKDALITS